jgi:hypothetical protein
VVSKLHAIRSHAETAPATTVQRADPVRGRAILVRQRLFASCAQERKPVIDDSSALLIEDVSVHEEQAKGTRRMRACRSIGYRDFVPALAEDG